MTDQTTNKEQLIVIDKEILDFDIYPESFDSNSTEKPMTKILVKNISMYPIAVRVVTTKKEFYLVNPSYSSIKPNQTEEIKFTYISKELKEDVSGHKFKFQAVTINAENENMNPKAIYEIYNKNILKNFKTDEKGLRVMFNKRDSNSVNITNPIENSSIYQSMSLQNKEEINFERLKNEFQDLSNQLIILQNSNNELRLNARIKEANECGKNSK